MSSNCSNSMPAGDFWLQKPVYSFKSNNENFWLTGADAQSRITSDEDAVAPADATSRLTIKDEIDEITSDRNMRHELRREASNVYKHVPHRERPPLIVARRNARERRRVQAVNSAFTRLRKVVPIVNNRGKRVSKVKTLQTAIDYIHGLQSLLKQADMYQDLDIISNYRYQTEDFIHVFEDIENEF